MLSPKIQVVSIEFLAIDHEIGEFESLRARHTIRRMKPSNALHRYRDAIRRIIERGHLRNPRVFGSAVRGEDREGSDLDLLVDAEPGTTLFDLGGLQIELEELLGVPVELLTPEDLPPRIRERVLREAAPV